VPGFGADAQLGSGSFERYLIVAVGQLSPYIMGRGRRDARLPGDLRQGDAGIPGDQITGQPASFRDVDTAYPAIQADPDRGTH
jgi:hypothetical protein